jgi:hypothetical protein
MSVIDGKIKDVDVWFPFATTLSAYKFGHLYSSARPSCLKINASADYGENTYTCLYIVVFTMAGFISHNARCAATEAVSHGSKSATDASGADCTPAAAFHDIENKPYKVDCLQGHGGAVATVAEESS